jgi:opacity protein-like surface antigen
MKAIAALFLALATAAPLAAQPADEPAVSIRPFLMGMQQQFAARDSFEAVFGQASYPFWGGGADVAFRNFFIEVSASRFTQSGERVFRHNDENFQLGIPLSVRLTPVEVLGGYRFRRWSRIIPYGGAGFGSYKYEEESEFSEPAEDLEQRQSGFVVVAGAEVRAHRWVGVGVDVHYTRIGGILGDSGVSADVGEDDLGGVSARFKIMIGR